MKTLTIILTLFVATTVTAQKHTNKTKALSTVCLSDDTGNESSEAIAVKTITNGVDSVTCYMLTFTHSEGVNTFVSLTTSNKAKESVTKLKAQLSEADQTKITNFKNSIE